MELELENMTTDNLNMLINAINEELDKRKCRKYQRELTELIEDIVRDGYNIKISGYNNVTLDSVVLINEHHNIFEVVIE